MDFTWPLCTPWQTPTRRLERHPMFRDVICVDICIYSECGTFGWLAAPQTYQRALGRPSCFRPWYLLAVGPHCRLNLNQMKVRGFGWMIPSMNQQCKGELFLHAQIGLDLKGTRCLHIEDICETLFLSSSCTCPLCSTFQKKHPRKRFKTFKNSLITCRNVFRRIKNRLVFWNGTRSVDWRF